jgi:hypothetical protein
LAHPALEAALKPNRRMKLSLLLVSPSLHAVVEDLALGASVSKGGLTLALVQVTVIVALNLEFVRAEGLPSDAARQKHRRKD